MSEAVAEELTVELGVPLLLRDTVEEPEGLAPCVSEPVGDADTVLLPLLLAVEAAVRGALAVLEELAP